MLIIKSIIYRIIRVLLLLTVSYFVIGDIQTALSISFIDMIVATFYYYYFDKTWEKFGEPFFNDVFLKFKYRKFDNDDLK